MGVTMNLDDIPADLVDNLLILQNEIDKKQEEDNKKIKNGRT